MVFYNRCNEAGAMLKPGDFDWKAIFAQGVRWVHCGGLFASLSASTAALAAEMMREAKAAGAVTSFDLNYRAKLWKIQGGDAKAVETIGKIVENVDVLVGNEEDLQMGLGIPGPEVAAKSKLDPSVFFGMMEKVTKKLPNAKVVATTLREVHSTNRHSWSAVAWMNGKTYQAPMAELDVVDRVGGGDGFAAGFIYGLLTGADPGRSGEAGLGPRGLADHLPRRHDHGDGGPGKGVRQGRFGSHSTVKIGEQRFALPSQAVGATGPSSAPAEGPVVAQLCQHRFTQASSIGRANSRSSPRKTIRFLSTVI